MATLLDGLAEPFTAVEPAEAVALLAERWGIAAVGLTRLETERDDTFRVSVAGGDVILKVAHPNDPAELIDLQSRALEHARAADPGIPLQHVVPTLAGDLAAEVGDRTARVLTWLDGDLVLDSPQTPALFGDAGRMLGRLNRALADFDHPAADRDLAWDLPHLPDLRPHATDPLHLEIIDRFAAETVPALAELPHQVIHNDGHPGNLLVDPANPDVVAGILDFGDATRSPRVCDLAVALAYLVPDAPRPWPDVDAFTDGIRERRATDRRRARRAADAHRRPHHHAHRHQPGDEQRGRRPARVLRAKRTQAAPHPGGRVMVGPTSYFDPARAGELDPRTADLVRRRAAALGPAYRLFYREPLEFVRGERAHLFDRDGADYLDAYNNVPSVGHAHPRVVAAIAEQAARLNTHTRYLSEATIEYAEQLLATFDFPAHVMFTCTGSEANDLALRVAKAATGGEGVIVTWNAYHGVTTEVAGISPSLVGVDGMPAWARAVRAPGRVPGGPAANIAEAVDATIGELTAFGIRPAALIVDTIFASDGVYPAVEGLRDAVAAIRKAGGLFIADEVQPGFGRLGDGMWGYARHGLEPDIVTLGKPMGNGHPVAAMVARPEVLAPFARDMRYFNTFGGNPVAIAAAQATLDVLRDEGLVENARVIGERIADGVRAIGDARIAEVRGAGLFIGVDLVDADGHPDEAFTLDVVNGLRDRRVLLSATAVDNATLKIRPPLVFDEADADRLLTELAAVLQDLPA